MKKTLLLLLMMAHLAGSAQKIEKFFDYNWKPCDISVARYYALIEFKDSLWSRHDYYLHERRLQMEGRYRDSACKIPEGLFHYYHTNGSMESTGSYASGKRQGLWLKYHPNGMMQDSTFYVKGQPSGTSMGWHSNGYLRDSIVYMSGRSVHVGWFDNGNPSLAGIMVNDSMHGKWSFYHKNGNLSAQETYNRGTLVSRHYFDEAGQEMTDTTNRDRPAEFNGGQKAWTKYMLSKLYFPDQYKITGADRAIVIINAVIDEEGNVTDEEVSSSFHSAFDNIALKMMKASPKWKPAISHNRKVKYYIRQPVTFAQPESD